MKKAVGLCGFTAMRKSTFITFETHRVQISCTITTQLIRAYCFATYFYEMIYMLSYKVANYADWFVLGTASKSSRNVFLRQGSFRSKLIKSFSTIYDNQMTQLCIFSRIQTTGSNEKTSFLEVCRLCPYSKKRSEIKGHSVRLIFAE